MKNNRFEQIMRSARGQLPALFLFSFFSNVLLLVTPLYMLQIFDRVLSSGSIDTLIWLSIIAVVAILVYGLLEQVRKRLLTRIGDWVGAELSPVVIRQSVLARLRESNTEATLDDVADVRSFIGGDAILAFLDAPWTPVFIACIWILHPVLGTIAIAGAVIIFAIALINDVATRGKQDDVVRSTRASTAAAAEYVENAETVSPMGMTDALISRWVKRSEPIRADNISLTDVNSRLINLSRALRLIMQVAVLGAGAALVQFAELTPGGMIAGSIIMARALSPIERSIIAWRSFVSYRKAQSRLKALFRAVPEDNQTIELPRPTGKFEVDSAGFTPKGLQSPVLKKIDFRLAPGETCGLIGPSGSGKSTLCKLLVGAHKPDYGTVRLDGADVSSWNPEQLGPHIGYLAQDVELFSGTIAENIARMSEASDEDIVSAAQQAGAHDMILKLKDGYETQVGLHGDNLSGGQRQLLGLARAFFRDPAVLVLDEPNANLDGDGELALMRGLDSAKKRGATIVIVAHQPNMLRFADKVLVLKEGLVARFGPRDEVLQSLMKSTPPAGKTEVDTGSQNKSVAGSVLGG